MFADDIILRIHRRVTFIVKRAIELLSINVEKSKVLVFRKGGKSKPGENWHIGEHVLEIVDQFTYL